MKNKAEGIILHDFKLYYRDIVIKTAWYWHRNRHMDEWNRIESLEVTPCIYDQLVFDKGTKDTTWGKDSLFDKWCLGNWISRWKRMEWNFILLNIKVNSKQVKELNVRPETSKILEENIGQKLFDTDLGKECLDLMHRQ